jgi:hypothetical protein
LVYTYPQNDIISLWYVGYYLYRGLVLIAKFAELRDDSDDNEVPRIKKPVNPAAVAQQLKSLDTEIERIRSVADLDDKPSRITTRLESGVENLSCFAWKAPSEVLGEMFLSCLSRWDEFQGNDAKHHG